MEDILTERLLLRSLTEEDAEAMFYCITSDKDVTKYLTYYPHEDISETKIYIKNIISQYSNPFYFYWAVELRETKELIGCAIASGYTPTTRSFEVGYSFGKAHWGKGYASETLKAINDFIFKKTNVDMIYSKLNSLNLSSVHVLKKAGMKCDAVLKGHGVSKDTGERFNKCYYSIRREIEYKNICPVCKKFWFVESHEICPICGWQNDKVQNEDENYEGGANKLSLKQARKAYYEK